MRLASPVIKESVMLLQFSFRSGAKCAEHVGISEKSVTLGSQDGSVDFTAHVAAGDDLSGGYINLLAMIVGVFDCGPVHHTIEAGPKGGAHAHGAGLAGGVEGVAGERKVLQFFGGQSDGSDFSVGAGVEFS